MNAITTGFPALALTTDGDVVILDYTAALEHFVHGPISAQLGYDAEAIPDLYDDDLILSNIAVYDSMSGREGFRLRQDLTEDRYWQLVESASI